MAAHACRDYGPSMSFTEIFIHDIESIVLWLNQQWWFPSILLYLIRYLLYLYRSRAQKAVKKEYRYHPFIRMNTLYNLSAYAIAKKFFLHKNVLPSLPESIYFKIYSLLYIYDYPCILGTELSDLEVFSRMLKMRCKKSRLMYICRDLTEHGIDIYNDIAINYNVRCLETKIQPKARESTLNLGLKLASFFNYASRYVESEQILLACRKLCIMDRDDYGRCCRTLDCCYHLLQAQSAYCSFEGAAETYELALNIIHEMDKAGIKDCNHAALFAEFSVLFFDRGEYNEAYKWSVAALKELKPSVPHCIRVDVLRQAAKSCVVMCKFQKAKLLMHEVLHIAHQVFGDRHPKYGDVLLDYGFYLLNYGSTYNSVLMYLAALYIRLFEYGCHFKTAIAYQKLANALYVRALNIWDYENVRHWRESYDFLKASSYSSSALNMMNKHLPAEHLLVVNAKRVFAQNKESFTLSTEIYYELSFYPFCSILRESQYYLSALRLTQAKFGERNVLTAKRYRNLGYFYHTIEKCYEKAEEMYLKAIEISEEILGPDHYLVAVSISHLASLYSGGMQRYRDAEKLYNRSIAINLKIDGPSSKALGHDYNGLLKVYSSLRENDKVTEYRAILYSWRALRKQREQSEKSVIDRFNPRILMTL